VKLLPFHAPAAKVLLVAQQRRAWSLSGNREKARNKTRKGKTKLKNKKKTHQPSHVDTQAATRITTQWVRDLLLSLGVWDVWFKRRACIGVCR
jgi:hypothetical protein